MSEDSKTRDYGKYLRRRNKFPDNAGAAIKLVDLYDKNEVEVECVCNRECLPNGKYGRSTHKKHHKVSQATRNGQKTQREAYCREQNFKVAENLQELQRNQKLNKTFTSQVLPKIDFSKYYLKPKSKVRNEVYENKYERKFFKCARERVSKIYPKKLSMQSNWSRVSVSVASSAMMQDPNDPYEQFQSQVIFPTPKANIRFFNETVAVYSVFDQSSKISKSKKATFCLGSDTSFNLQFYKSMGDGRPMSRRGPAYISGDGRMSRDGPGYKPGDGRPAFRATPVYIGGDGRQMSGGGPAYLLVPQNYSVSRLQRDEDGRICAGFPQDDYCNGNILTKSCEEDSFLKGYLHRALMKKQKRCICGKQHKKGQFCPYRTCRRNVGCQCKCNNNNATILFLGNDAACQCKYKDNREHGSDRESFYRERGITCIVPKTPTQCSKCSSENMFNTGYSQRQHMERQTVNIGSNFSFKMGFYKRGINNQPNRDCCSYNIPTCDDPCPQFSPCIERGGDNDPCSRSTVSSCCQPKSCCSTPKINCKSSNTKSAKRAGDSCYCSGGKSNETICCCPRPAPDRCYSPCKLPSYVPCKSIKTNNKNKGVGSCCSKPILVECSDNKICDIKPILAECANTNKKNVGVCCSTCILPVYTKPKFRIMKNAGCCKNKQILCKCTNKKKIGGVCCGTKNRSCCCDIKSIIIKCANKRNNIEICCSKCKRPKKTEGYCCCDGKHKSSSKLSLISKSQSGCCCQTLRNNEPSVSLVEKLHMYFKNRGRGCKKCNSMFNQRLVPTKDAQCECKCQKKVGGFDYKNVLTKMQVATERKRQARAQQCPCKGRFDYTKLFGRLLLFNVQEASCCTSESCGKEGSLPFSKSVGIGEADLRKPPCQRKAYNNKHSYFFKKLFCKLIKQETLLVRHQQMFGPLNQCETAIQHCSSDGPNDRVGKEIICRNQGSSAPKCKQITERDCENGAGEPVDPNQKTIRLGSSCSFSVELYRGQPPSKCAKPSPPCSPCPPTCAQPTAECVTCPSSVCDECETPSVPFVQKAFANMILRNKKHLANKTTTCQKCNKCTKVPLIKRGFVQLLLTDAKQRKTNRICQKTNTLQPVRRVVKRRPGCAAPARGKPKSEPYVCLKRVNQKKCCNK